VLAGYLVAFDKHMNLVSVVNNKVYLFVCLFFVGSSRKSKIMDTLLEYFACCAV